MITNAVFAGPLYGACIAACYVACGATAAVVPAPALPAEILYCIKCCTAACIWSCFSKDTTIVVLENGEEIEKNIAEIHTGDMVGTLRNGELAWTKVLRNVKTEGDFEFIQIKAKDPSDTTNHLIRVTASHGMILMDTDGRLLLDTADHIKVGDEILATDGNVITVTEVDKVNMQDKFTLETADGTVIASDFFVSTICKEELADGQQPFNRTMENWLERHSDRE